MERPSCGTCPYWLPIEPDDVAFLGMTPALKGECHHDPAQLVAGEPGGLTHPHGSSWPPVPAGQFCGRHPLFLGWVAWRAGQQPH